MTTTYFFSGPAAAAAISVVMLTVDVSTVDAQMHGSPDVEGAARTISQADFAWRIGVIAHDSMGGRDTPSPGLDMTAEWAASELRRMGLRGGMPDGSFIQRYPLRSVEVDVDRSSVVSGAERLRYGQDILPLFGLAEGRPVRIRRRQSFLRSWGTSSWARPQRRGQSTSIPRSRFPVGRGLGATSPRCMSSGWIASSRATDLA